jgi:hypothetical protein
LEEILSSVCDTIDVMKLRGFIEEAGHASHSTNDLTDVYLTKDMVSVLLLELIENLLLFVNYVFHLLLESDRELSLGSLYHIGVKSN